MVILVLTTTFVETSLKTSVFRYVTFSVKFVEMKKLRGFAEERASKCLFVDQVKNFR